MAYLPRASPTRRTSAITYFRSRIAKGWARGAPSDEGRFMIVQSGEATLVYGGQVIDPQPSAPNEIQGSGNQGGHQDCSQSRRCHPHPHRHTAPVFPRSRQADHIHARKSRRSAQSKSLKARAPNRSETRVKHVSHLSHGSNSINSTTVGMLNGTLSRRISGVRLKNLSAGTCDRCE